VNTTSIDSHTIYTELDMCKSGSKENHGIKNKFSMCRNLMASCQRERRITQYTDFESS